MLNANGEEIKKKPISFEQKIENDIVKKGLTAPRVTKEQIDILYAKLKFEVGQISSTRIICMAALDGFIIADGFSACVDPRNFDMGIGTEIATKNCATAAYAKLWELEGYRLSRSLNETAEKQ